MGSLTFSYSGDFFFNSHRFKLGGLPFWMLLWINSEPWWACGYRDPCLPSRHLWPFQLSPVSTGAAFIDSALRASHFASETILFKVTHLLAPPCCVSERRPRFVQGGGPGLTWIRKMQNWKSKHVKTYQKFLFILFYVLKPSSLSSCTTYSLESTAFLGVSPLLVIWTTFSQGLGG